MHPFKDNAGRTWIVLINVAAVKRCRALVSVDLYGLVDDQFSGLGKLIADPVALVDVIYCLCQDEAGKLGITDEDFGRSMAGDALEHAANAFLAELTDFFPDARVRTGLAKVLTASRQVRDQLLDQAIESLDQLDLESVVRTLKASSGVSPESSDSIPARLRSVS